MWLFAEGFRVPHAAGGAESSQDAGVRLVVLGPPAGAPGGLSGQYAEDHADQLAEVDVI
jgi:hypothetical protein